MAACFCPHCMAEIGRDVTACPECGGNVTARNVGNQLPVGTELISPSGRGYRLGLAKGQGGFGITYIGRDLSGGELVAVKEYHPARCQPRRGEDGSLHPQTAWEESYRQGIQSFMREAQMLTSARNIPSVVKVLDLFEANGTAYMVMEYLQGMTLQQLVETQGRISFDELMEKFAPFLRDIDAMHSRLDLIHRDIAPDNIMLTPEGKFKLMDFGCARSMEDGKSMTVLLKPGFAPLEQYTTHGQQAYTDLYALCATIYYCITGAVPSSAPDRMVAIQGKPDPLRPPSELGAEIKPEQEQVLLWGLALQPPSRPQTVREFLARLGLAEPETPGPEPVVEEPVVEPPAPAPEPVPVPAPGTADIWEKIAAFLRENKLLVGIAAAVVLILLIFALV